MLGYGLSGSLRAASPAAPPKPANAIPPDAALERLIKGNKRYISGATKRVDFASERPALVMGQNPFAAILGCADSRVGPEFAFDTGRGDLFVCRVAGNFAETNNKASLEYSVAALGTPLIVVLGHESCGAIDSAIKAYKKEASFPGHIPQLLQNLYPAVKIALQQPGDPLNNAIRENVVLNVKKLQTCSPILSKAVETGKLKIVGGVYHLETGLVEFLA